MPPSDPAESDSSNNNNNNDDEEEERSSSKTLSRSFRSGNSSSSLSSIPREDSPLSRRSRPNHRSRSTPAQTQPMNRMSYSSIPAASGTPPDALDGSSHDLEGGPSVSPPGAREETFGDEGEAGTTTQHRSLPALTWRATPDRRIGRYESVPNPSDAPRSTTGNSWCCCSALVQTVLVVAAMALVATAGFLVGSAKPDLLVAVLNSTAGIDMDIDMDASALEAGAAEVGVSEASPGGNETESGGGDQASGAKRAKKVFRVRYDPSAVLSNDFVYGSNDNDNDNDNHHNNHHNGKDAPYRNPFDSPPKSGDPVFATPPHPFSTGGIPAPAGYLKSPHLAGDRLVFLSEGDAYATTLSGGDGDSSLLPAARVTTTVGNVLDPRWHPTLPLLAYTATYSGRREVYLLDMGVSRSAHQSARKSPVRLTYWNVGGGVSGLVGWIDNDNDTDDAYGGGPALVFRASSNEASLPDYRLYVLRLGRENGGTEGFPSVEPVPLAQATDAAWHGGCWYFVRVKQSSQTIRYAGGTAENLWRYCERSEKADDDDAAASGPLLAGDAYRGTSKSPQIYRPDTGGPAYLFFLSDRGPGPEDAQAAPSWIPDRMNVWALALVDGGGGDGESRSSYSPADLVRITDTACDFEGRTVREFTVDRASGTLVARIGADLYAMPSETVRARLEAGGKQRRERRRLARDREDEDEVEYLRGARETPAVSSTGVPTAEDNDQNDDDDDDAQGYSSTSTSTSTSAPSFDEEESEEAASASGDAVPAGAGAPVVPVAVETVPPTEDPTITPQTAPPTVAPVAVATEEDTGANANSTAANSTEPPARYYYDFEPPELVPRTAEDTGEDHFSGSSADLRRLPIAVYSDFANDQERLVPVNILKHYTYGDVFETLTGDTQALLTLRGQAWVAPVGPDEAKAYKEDGKNLPARRYRLGPGATTGGSTRILAALHVPNPVEDGTSDRRLAVLLATDPLTPTAEHAFYLVEAQPGASPLFADPNNLPRPFLGGMVSGGSTIDGGLGSVKTDTLAMSPCGNRMAWSDTDGRIVAMNLPHYQEPGDGPPEHVVLPKRNDLGEPMVGDSVDLRFSPGGRYLAITHHAKNRFQTISVADLGDPLAGEDRIAPIRLGRIAQVTPARFNSWAPVWGTTSADAHDHAQNKTMAKLLEVDPPDDVAATTLYFLSDRDIKTDVTSPWGYRQRMPHFVQSAAVYALPLVPENGSESEPDRSRAGGPFRGGGAAELGVGALLERMDLLEALLDDKAATKARRRERRRLAESLHPLAGAFGHAKKAFADKRRRVQKEEEEAGAGEEAEAEDDHLREAVFEQDMNVDFGPRDLTLARTAYRIASIPEGDYDDLLCQTPTGDLVAFGDSKLVVFQAGAFPSDTYEAKPFAATSRKLELARVSSDRRSIVLLYSPDGAIRVVPNSASGLAALQADAVLDDSVVDWDGLHLSIWPTLEYRQLYDDAWRMLRDYFYDPGMAGIDWPAIHGRYLPLVERCSKREELDDVLIQMSSELSALHVFVYGGEYNSPIHGDKALRYVNEVGSLGAVLKRNPAWKGYTVESIAEADPDFGKIDQSSTIYSPLSDRSLRLSGQRGLEAGDVIVGINGESILSVPDPHMLLRGTAGRSVRLDVLRLASGPLEQDGSSDAADAAAGENAGDAPVESLIVVPLSPDDHSNLLYRAWEWKTERLAEELAEEAGISVGYVHLKDMSGASAEDAFARGFFPNYHKQGFILDVRHNRGGNIDSWVLDVLQRKAWMYWQSRDFDPETGGLGWDEHYAFRGHLVVLVDEKTSSDGEGVSRGISELGLGKLIGTRTWGGGIWLASDNRLVDGGIASAPEIGVYNENWSWGMGIENLGLEPDIVVDNDPHETYTGRDRQLETAIEVLKNWIEDEPIPIPKPKTKRKDVTMGDRECGAR